MTDASSSKTVYRPTEVTAKRGVAFDIRPDAAARAALAEDLGCLSIPSLTFRGKLRPHRRADFRLEGELDAVAEQACVVTLEPVRTTISETVVRTFVADWTPPAETEAEMPEDDTAEPLGRVIDLGDVLREALALALPAYPRAPGVDAAEAEGGAAGGGAAGGIAGKGGGTGGEAAEDGRRRPFEGLDRLLRGESEGG